MVESFHRRAVHSLQFILTQLLPSYLETSPSFFGLQIMSSFVSQIMQPGGGLLLIPFVRLIIGTLLVLTLAGFLAGVARIHMAVLSFLSAGLLFSISMFESEYKKAQQYSSSSQSSSQQAATGGGKPAKSD